MCYVNSEVMNMWKKAALAAFALVVLAAAYVRPVYTVKVDGVPLPGSWSLSDISGASRMAEAAAAEIARAGTAVPAPDTQLHLSILPGSGDTVELARGLLAATPGVSRAWRVSVDGLDIGLTADGSALGETVLEYIAQSAPADCVSAVLENELELSEVYIPSGRADDLMELSGRLRSLTRVCYTTSSGELIYA